ncbi:SMI1/KNR4 family protein [Dactylosporangium sp. NPDC049742]|uniref:SMI1/KNR4 family protein n=1 Tax=Dactylosporangium sp. NPDC049742 TaxID=3154737 RepID=UPI0034357E0D
MSQLPTDPRNAHVAACADGARLALRNNGSSIRYAALARLAATDGEGSVEFMARDVLDRAAAVGRDVELADVHGIFRHGGPNPGADLTELAVLRQRVDLPPSYLEFLTCCDGWAGLDGQTDMFPIAELLDGPATERAWVLVEAYDEGSGWQFGFSRDRYLVIGAAESSLSVVLLDLLSAPRVCWLTQGGVENFPTLDALMTTATEDQLETLAALQADPWLGIADDDGRTH